MEITRENFEAVLLTLSDVFKNAQFIAFDTEFTGLKVEGASNLNYFDTLEDLYLKTRLKAETFIAIQIGFAVFFYDESTNKYSHLSYNFYVYPSAHVDINFTCQSKSIQFLIEHGFNFNKLFKEGIPYLKDEEVERLIEKLTEKSKKIYSVENATKVEIPNEHKMTVDNILNKIQHLLDSKEKTSFTTEKHNSFVRRLIYNSVQLEFGSNVFLESNNDDSMTISVGFTAQELKDKQKEIFLMKKQQILDDVGFSKVIKLLMESKKLLVGHNLLLDILFIIKQFLVPLPESYSEFKELVKFLFPLIIDTKYMAASEMKNIKDTSLNYLVEHFENTGAFPEVLVHKNGVGHEIQKKKLHEASYDAYLTGLCFLAMVEQMGKNNNLNSEIFKNLPESSILQPILNKLSTPRLHDIFFMNVGGLDNVPDRLGVYHLTFPQEWTRDNIMNLFKNCGFINISWINSTSAFIKVKTEYIEYVEKNLMSPNSKYKLLTHTKFKSSSYTSNDLLLSPFKGNQSDSNLNNSINNDSFNSVHSADVGKKRKMEEDIGEVIERPQKKQNFN